MEEVLKLKILHQPNLGVGFDSMVWHWINICICLYVRLKNLMGISIL